MRHSPKSAQWRWGWRCYNCVTFLLGTIVFQVVIRVEAVEPVEYRTFDLANDGKVLMRSDNDGERVVRANTGTFAPRSGSMDIRGRYWSKIRRDPEYPEDQESEASTYVTVNQDGDELHQDVCDTGPCIAFDRVDLDRQHSFTINMPRMEGRNHVFKKFVVQPVIQYVMQYDKNSERERGEQTAASTNYEEYEGSQGQNKMRRHHEEGIDRFFNDINAKFEGYWGNDENRGGGQGGGYSQGGGGQGGGYGQGDGWGSGNNNGGYRDGGDGGGYNNNNNGGGGTGIDLGFGFGSGGSGGGWQSSNNGNNQQQQEVNGYVSAGAYGPPGMTGGGQSPASMGGMSGSSDTSSNGGMSLTNAVQMSNAQQGDAQMLGMNSGGNSNQMGGGAPTTASVTPSGTSGMPNMMGMGQVGMSQAQVFNHGMGMGMMQNSQPMPMTSMAPSPGPTYGAPGMTPGQPMGPMELMQQQQNHQSMQMPYGGGNGMVGMMGSASPQPMNMQMSTMQPMMGGGMQTPTTATFGGNQMGGYNQQMTNMMGGDASNQMASNSAGNSGMSGMQAVPQPSYGPPATNAPSHSYGSIDTSISAPSQQYGPPKPFANNSPSSGSTSSSESQNGSKEEGYESSKERPSRPSRGKKPSGGGGSKSKGRGRGRGKSLFSSLSNLPKIPASIGGHLSFMFSTGFGKNRKGRNNSNGGGSKPGEEAKSKPIDKEQVSDHILNILGLTVHHPPGHLTNNASDYNSTNPIVIWELHGNSTNLTQLASHFPGATLGDIVAHLPLVEVVLKSSSRSPKSANIEKTEDPITTTELPYTTEEVIMTTTEPESLPQSTFPTMTVVKNVTLAQAIAILTHHLNLSSQVTTTKAPTTTSLPILPTTTTTPSTPPPSPVFTTSPRPTTTPHLTKDTLSRFRFRQPKNLKNSPQTQFFPKPIPVFLTPPPPPPSPKAFSLPPPPPPSSFSQSSQSLVNILPTPFDPVQEYINQNLSNNVLTLDENDTHIVSSVSISPPPQSAPIPKAKIEAYYAESDVSRNPIKLIQFEPWIYDALQAAFQPYDVDEALYVGSSEFKKRKRSWDRQHRLNFLPNPKDVRSRNNLVRKNISAH